MNWKKVSILVYIMFHIPYFIYLFYDNYLEIEIFRYVEILSALVIIVFLFTLERKLPNFNTKLKIFNNIRVLNPEHFTIGLILFLFTIEKYFDGFNYATLIYMFAISLYYLSRIKIFKEPTTSKHL